MSHPAIDTVGKPSTEIARQKGDKMRVRAFDKRRKRRAWRPI
jgi:uncharacterized protein (UPF0218 family)